MTEKKIRVGILGATGLVGQRLITLLTNHPWFEVVSLAASPSSAGKPYAEAVQSRWMVTRSIPKLVKTIEVLSVAEDLELIVKSVEVVFSAIKLKKQDVQEIETKYAESGVPVISCNSAHRWTEDVPMIIPEVNPNHTELIKAQRMKRNWSTGLIVTKPNCSIQSFVPILTALLNYKPIRVNVTSIQAISGAGKYLSTWPEMVDNVIPLIEGEEEKSEKEPMKIWGHIRNQKLALADKPLISATCVRVPVTDGHMASVSVQFEQIPTKQQILDAISNYANPIANMHLPSAPEKFIKYLPGTDRPQTKTDRMFEDGMGITVGRLRKDKLDNWLFIALSHNTIRGAAGGAILLAELLNKQGFIVRK